MITKNTPPQIAANYTQNTEKTNMKKLIAVAVLAAFSSLPYAAEKDITTDVVVVGQGAHIPYTRPAGRIPPRKETQGV